jgi:hypothetical protein
MFWQAIDPVRPSAIWALIFRARRDTQIYERNLP